MEKKSVVDVTEMVYCRLEGKNISGENCIKISGIKKNRNGACIRCGSEFKRVRKPVSTPPLDFSKARTGSSGGNGKVHRGEENQVILIPVGNLVPDPEQPRMYFDLVALECLKESIRENGQKQPIVIFQDGEKSIILDGERRWRCIKELGWKEISCFIISKPKDKREKLLLSLLYNFCRESHTVEEEVIAAKKLLDSGMAQAGIARAIGKSQMWVSQRLALLNLRSEVFGMLSPKLPEEKRINISAAYELSKIEDKEIQLSLALEMVKKKMTLCESRTLIEATCKERGLDVRRKRKVKPSDIWKRITPKLRAFLFNFRRNLNEGEKELEIMLRKRELSELRQLMKDLSECMALSSQFHILVKGVFEKKGGVHE
ncbi:MAG: ParB/RepB/Spo0J family partition protein [Candidatus Paceibacterota bacterium]